MLYQQKGLEKNLQAFFAVSAVILIGTLLLLYSQLASVRLWAS